MTFLPAYKPRVSPHTPDSASREDVGWSGMEDVGWGTILYYNLCIAVYTPLHFGTASCLRANPCTCNSRP